MLMDGILLGVHAVEIMQLQILTVLEVGLHLGVMYPYTDSLGVTYPNNNDCHDSSPKFYEKPRTILEVNNGYDPTSLTNGFTYSHNAFDQEQDSIVYDWGIPIDNSYDYLNPTSSAISFVSPYSYSSPINGITLNSVTGRTSYPADQAGNYVTY